MDIGFDRYLDQMHHWHEMEHEPDQTECSVCGKGWEDCDSDGGAWYPAIGVPGGICWDCYQCAEWWDDVDELFRVLERLASGETWNGADAHSTVERLKEMIEEKCPRW